MKLKGMISSFNKINNEADFTQICNPSLCRKAKNLAISIVNNLDDYDKGDFFDNVNVELDNNIEIDPILNNFSSSFLLSYIDNQRCEGLEIKGYASNYLDMEDESKKRYDKRQKLEKVQAILGLNNMASIDMIYEELKKIEY